MHSPGHARTINAFFAIVGAALFAVSATETELPTAAPGQITEGDLQQMLVGWRAQGGLSRRRANGRQCSRKRCMRRCSTATRGLVQKMGFLAEDLSARREPTQDDLQAWIEAHPEELATPPRVGFHHVYFSFDKHEPETRAAARTMPAPSSAASLSSVCSSPAAVNDPGQG